MTTSEDQKIRIFENPSDGGKILIKGPLSSEQQIWVDKGIWRILSNEEAKEFIESLYEL